MEEYVENVQRLFNKYWMVFKTFHQFCSRRILNWALPGNLCWLYCLLWTWIQSCCRLLQHHCQPSCILLCNSQLFPIYSHCLWLHCHSHPWIQPIRTYSSGFITMWFTFSIRTDGGCNIFFSVQLGNQSSHCFETALWNGLYLGNIVDLLCKWSLYDFVASQSFRFANFHTAFHTDPASGGSIDWITGSRGSTTHASFSPLNFMTLVAIWFHVACQPNCAQLFGTHWCP